MQSRVGNPITPNFGPNNDRILPRNCRNNIFCCEIAEIHPCSASGPFPDSIARLIDMETEHYDFVARHVDELSIENVEADTHSRRDACVLKGACCDTHLLPRVRPAGDMQTLRNYFRINHWHGLQPCPVAEMSSCQHRFYTRREAYKHFIIVHGDLLFALPSAQCEVACSNCCVSIPNKATYEMHTEFGCCGTKVLGYLLSWTRRSL